MKKYELETDVEELLEKVFLEEATREVWKAFELALNELPQPTRDLLEKHFEGASRDEICREQSLSKPELDDWLTQAKRDLVEQLRRKVPVRQ